MFDTYFRAHRLPVWLCVAVAAGALQAQVRPRILSRIDDRVVVRVAHTTHPLATAANDRGRVAPDLPMERVLLQLQSSPEQEAALQQLLMDQQDPASPRYRQWLTPQEFGEQFGAAQQDIDTIAAWLAGEGFRVGEVAAGRRAIEFSGTARDVEQAFHTEMHRYAVNGEEHIANATDIAIPRALASVVAGIVKLNDFRPRPLHRTVRARPLANVSGSGHALAPYDFAAIYNVTPLWNTGFDGSGQSIAIPGHSSINPNDIAAFRSAFGLPGNNTQVILNGKNPGILGGDEETEADLDVEWSGAVARGANIQFVVSADTSATDGITLSSTYIVNNNLASAMSVSFGACEAAMASANQYYNSLWSQAAAQGISVFVAAGDSGAAGCDAAASTVPAVQGFGVNGLASTPYNVAVGGTQFDDAATLASYWNSGNSAQMASAKGYIPEAAWNESSYVAGATGNGLWAGGGGASSVYPTPPWQTGRGVPSADPGTGSQHHRYLPDVSLAAAGREGYLVYREGKLYEVGGTSAASPAMAGILAIVDQHSGGRAGNPNPRLYALAGSTPSVYHDTGTGTNAVPCRGGSRNCSAAALGTIGTMNGYSAGAGFDLATGWGSVDAYELALNWGVIGSAAPAPSIASLSPNPMPASSAAQVLTIAGAHFQSGAKVTVGAATYSGTQLALSATQIRVSMAASAAGSFNVRVTNPDGQSSPPAVLTVQAPPPSISSLNPNPLAGTLTATSLTINGSGFLAGATVQLACSGAAATAYVTSSSANRIVALVNVGTTARTWTVKVINPGGAASAAANLTVTAPPVRRAVR